MIEVDEQTMHIGGHWSTGSGAPIAVVNPSTEAELGRSREASPAEVAAAVAAARTAFDAGDWPLRSLAERAELVERAAAAVERDAAAIGATMTAEMGVPYVSGRVTAQRCAETMRFYAGLTRELPVAEVRGAEIGAAVVREPGGVVAAIAPWNGPFSMATIKIVPALLAGCTVVFKAAPESPFDVRYLVDALAAAGLPPGVLNVVAGAGEVGRALVADPGVDRVSFTGSTAVGRQIGAVCGEQLKPVHLKLGGKSAAIVLPDADPEVLRAGLAVGCFSNSGQVCAALSRILAPREHYEQIVELAVEAAGSWVVGDPMDETTTLGPLVSRRQRDRVADYVAAGVADGARVVVGGGAPTGRDTGWFFAPTVLDQVDNGMQIAREEIFGPVTVVIPYDGIDDATAIANDSPYGLHGAVFTTDDAAALGVARRIRTGTFTVNGFRYNNRAPFGGVKASGLGRDTGPEGLTSYFDLKTINIAPGMDLSALGVGSTP